MCIRDRAEVACAGDYALALAHVAGPAAGLAEIRRLETYMHQLHLDPQAHKVHWDYFFTAKMLVLEQAGDYQAACDLMQREGMARFQPSDIRRLSGKLKRGW